MTAPVFWKLVQTARSWPYSSAAQWTTSSAADVAVMVVEMAVMLIGMRVFRFGWVEIGAGDGIRTRDIDLGKVALYQLSYSRA